MKSFLEEYSRIIGFLLLVFVIIIVFSTPFMIHARTITRYKNLYNGEIPRVRTFD